MPNFFDKENYVLHYENLQLYWKLELQPKKNKNTHTWLKANIEFKTQRRIEAEKINDKMLYKLMNTAIYQKKKKKNGKRE